MQVSSTQHTSAQHITAQVTPDNRSTSLFQLILVEAQTRATVATRSVSHKFKHVIRERDLAFQKINAFLWYHAVAAIWAVAGLSDIVDAVEEPHAGLLLAVCGCTEPRHLHGTELVVLVACIAGFAECDGKDEVGYVCCAAAVHRKVVEAVF